MDNVRISKINIKIGKKEISLTLDKAKELQDILDKTFGKTFYVEGTPQIIMSYPVCPSPVYPVPYKDWEITWKGTAANTGDETLTCTLVS